MGKSIETKQTGGCQGRGLGVENNRSLGMGFHLGGMKMFLRLGKRIPQEMSIAAFDSIFAAKLVEPELTVTDARYIEAAKLAVELIAGHDGELKNIKIPPILCRGGSVSGA